MSAEQSPLEAGSHATKLVILGTRLFAEEVADLVAACRDYELVAFAENWERERAGRSLVGRPIMWVDDLAPLAATHQAVCAIGTTRRAGFVRQVQALGFRFATVCHPAARLSATATVGPGSILSAGVIVAAHTALGSHVIVNRGSLIGHHTVIGDFVTVSPGANIAGCVRIGSGSYVGMGAVILDRVTIGDNAVVGAGAVVARDVPDSGEVVAAPARLLSTEAGTRG